MSRFAASIIQKSFHQPTTPGLRTGSRGFVWAMSYQLMDKADRTTAPDQADPIVVGGGKTKQ